MRLLEGRIGKQENANIIGIAAACGSVFTIDSSEAYTRGNSTYLTVPLSIAVSLAIFLFALYAIKKSGQRSVIGLLRYSLGGAVGAVFAAIFSIALVLSGFHILERFANMTHSFIFPQSEYANIVLYIVLTAAVMAFMGFECIGRVAKCFGVLTLVLMLATYVAAIPAYEAYRLFPLFGNGAAAMAMDTLRGTFSALPAFLAPLCLVSAAQGDKSLATSGLVGGGGAILFALATQLAIGLSYPYDVLSGMFAPLLRVNMILVNESYLLRYDKMVLFVLLVAGLIASAYYIYSAANLITRSFKMYDTRPCVLSLSVVIACLLIAEHQRLYQLMQDVVIEINKYGWIALAAPILIASCVGLIKAKSKERNKKNESA